MITQPQTYTILLINPPIEDFYQTPLRQQPLGLQYIKAVMEKAGYHTILLDCLAENKKETISIPPKLNYLKTYYPPNDLSPFKLFTHYQHFGLSYDEIAAKLKLIQPDIIGISVNFTPYVNSALETAKICKSLFPGIPVIAGGHHATAVQDNVLETGYFDFIVNGEGEDTFLKIVQTVILNDYSSIKNLNGIAYRDEQGIIVNQNAQYIANLDELPFPKYEPSTIDHKNNSRMIITSRGCPKNCNFCSIHKVMGRKVRNRSIDSVLKEIETGINAGFRNFDFEDDHLTADMDRAKSLMAKINDSFCNYQLTLSALNGLSADELDEDLIRLMKSAGFEWLNIPLVSGSDTIQKLVKRNQSAKHFLSVVEWAQKYNLKMMAYIILGLPEDTVEQMIEDIVFLAKLPVIIGPSIFYPPPGSKTFEKCIQKSYISGKDYELYRSSAVSVETENFTRTDIITLFRLVRIINYVKFLNDKNAKSVSAQISQKSPLIFNEKLSSSEIGNLLLDQFFTHNKLRGLFLKAGAKNKYQYEWINYECSEYIISEFRKRINKDNIQ